MDVEPVRGAEASAVTEAVADDTASSAQGSYAKAEKRAYEDKKEESRRSFSTLVKTACSQRAYPY